MPRDAFVLKIQRELCHPKYARKVSGLSKNRPLDDQIPSKYALLGSTHFLATIITMTIMMTTTRNNNNENNVNDNDYNNSKNDDDDNDDSSKENDVDNDNYKIKYRKYNMCQNYSGPQGTCSKLKSC